MSLVIAMNIWIIWSYFRREIVYKIGYEKIQISRKQQGWKNIFLHVLNVTVPFNSSSSIFFYRDYNEIDIFEWLL